jgi:tetratricopeptide (TPR) repeat protein
MKIFAEIFGMFSFRSHALRVQAERRASIAGVILFCIGFLAYAIVRNSVYAVLPEIASQFAPDASFMNLNIVQVFLRLAQVLFFLLIVYIPALILLGNLFAGDGLGFSISRQEYQAHISALFPLWGVLFLIAAPLQWLIPFIPIRFSPNILVDISFGILILSILLFVYTLWAIQQLSYLSWVQSFGVFALSWFTFVVFVIFKLFVFALPLFILLPLIYLAALRIREHFSYQTNEQAFQRNMYALTLNPQDADAHYQLGLIHFKRRNFQSARKYFESALKIEPADPDCHYHLGRTYEFQGEWQLALEQYEETYQLNPEHGLGDIIREVGKAYLHTGSIEKGKEFLNFFLQRRNSDPEGRYWLAVAWQKLGDMDQMRFQLNMALEQARSSPRFFRKENREWIYRARNLIRDSRTSMNNAD